MTQLRPWNTFFLHLLLLAGTATGPLYAAKYHPIAAAKAPNGSLFLLTAENMVFAMNFTLSSGSVAGQFSFSNAGIVTDMTYGEDAGRGVLFIGSTFSTGQVIFGRVQEFTTEGKLLQYWTIQHIIAGLTFDPASRAVYFTSGDSPEVYSISLQAKSSANYVAEVTGASKLGAITVDPSGQNLYIADPRQGAVFSMSVSTHKVVQVCQVGTPQALLVDSTGQLLIVADSTRKEVVTSSIAGPKGPVRVLAPAGSFQAPAGLAWWDNSHILVADQDLGTISMIDSNTATRLYWLPLP